MVKNYYNVCPVKVSPKLVRNICRYYKTTDYIFVATYLVNRLPSSCDRSYWSYVLIKIFVEDKKYEKIFKSKLF